MTTQSAAVMLRGQFASSVNCAGRVGELSCSELNMALVLHLNPCSSADCWLSGPQCKRRALFVARRSFRPNRLTKALVDEKDLGTGAAIELLPITSPLISDGNLTSDADSKASDIPPLVRGRFQRRLSISLHLPTVCSRLHSLSSVVVGVRRIRIASAIPALRRVQTKEVPEFRELAGSMHSRRRRFHDENTRFSAGP